ncbi:hypothetical protein NM208_g7824 [Fusarium decemcellulare]|uniref:Uncharacterized protein n=1 Tax=Fusarium decemcellulare TaxID=57161 RepID=A0ACC1S7N2_9HYPO|nr:hypothetical protein NM208_g7824 [Fusarium decemcellulare]
MQRKSGPKQTVMPRACRNCRMRKVRCNRAVPCSNCITSSLECEPDARSTVRAARHVGDAARPLQGVNDDQSTDILERLAALEETVNALRPQQNRTAEAQTQPTPHYIDDTTQPEKVVDEEHANLPEGESSFGTQALNASQIAELTSTARSVWNQYVTGMPRKGLKSDIDLPPSSFVIQALRVLRELKGTQAMLFTFYGISDFAQVEEFCKRIYFPVEPASTADIILLNGTLSIILRQLIQSSYADLPQDTSHYQTICERNFQSSAESYEIMAIPSAQNAMILALAMIHAQSNIKLSLQSSLASTAARHCLALGYHREDRVSQLPQLEAQRVRRLFWHIYVLEQNLSSRLGRASTFPDFDIDVKPCSISRDPGQAPWDLAFNMFVEFARIVGKIYQCLYSASARKLDVKAKKDVTADLELQLIHWHDNWARLDSSNAYGKDAFDETFAPANIVYFSFLTLLHRGTTQSGSPRDISPACFDAAQQGLKAHLTYFPRLTSLGHPALQTYAYWIFYYTSFTPFVVTFIHCITNSDHGDLKLLADVLSGLEQTGLAFEYAEAQFNLCKALYRIAEAFITSQKSAPDNDVRPMNTLRLLQNPLSAGWHHLDSNSQFPDLLEAGASDWDIPDIEQMLFDLDH